MSGQWWESDLIVGPFADLAAANAWAVANPSSLFPGLLAAAGGATIMWGGSSWLYVGTPYVGGVKPAGYIGEEIQINNPAVPGGRSKLRWSRAVLDYVPPAGELIASVWGTGGSPLALITPGVTTLVEIYGATGNLSKVIPDYMVPDGLIWTINATMCAINASGASGNILGVGICGAVPSGAPQSAYPCNASVTPDNNGGVGFPDGLYRQKRSGNLYKHGGSSTSGRSIDQNSIGPFVSGSNRLYAMCKPSSTTDQIRLDGMSAISMGNL